MLLPAVAAGMMMIGTQAEAAAPQLAVAAEVAGEAQDAAPSAPSAATAQAPVQAPAAPPLAPQGDAAQDIVVTGDKGAPKGDPLEQLNAKSFEAVQSVDKAVVEPVAKAYNKGLPRPVRKGLRNFFSNLGEPIVAAAYLLQFKPGKAFETAGRFGVNTTLGFVGMFDVAKRKPFNLPHRDNGIANTLGFYGVGPGPYMYLPVVGPTTLRDIIGDTADKMILPFALGGKFFKPAYVIPATILNQLGERAAFDETITAIRKEDDPYTVYKTLYLKQRKAEIEALHGRVSAEPVVPIYGDGLRTPGKKDAPKVVLPDPYADDDAAEPAPDAPQ
ncbi:MlaA family lipoprotein [Sphingobium cupriresistens]|uniref:VacJ family lipoprotein n=1 Tax=Sphingobium cupriresistens TaxID=1132417 RepID=A0A8G1ZI87_9SPHN|nr:VacJ family lipoprotein [Sphingobium cupriresistens]RYM13603.1 VacJ family lipoprotein [Sphingobium cupriresistens]